MGLEFSNFNLLMDDLGRLARVAGGEAVNNALRKGAGLILMHAKANAKGSIRIALNIGGIKTGKYGRKSITIGVHRKDYTPEKPSEYVPAYVEFGHGGPHPAGAHPFVRTAFDAEAENALGIIKSELNQAIDKIGE